MPGALFAAFGIVRFIARAVSPNGRRLSPEDLRRLNREIYGLSFGAPLLMAALHILYQPNRYAIVRTTGCEFTYVVTWVSYLTWLVWGPLMAGISAFYAGASVLESNASNAHVNVGYICFRMWKSRRDLRKYALTTGMPASRFYRLVAMCCTFIGVTLPLALFATFSATTLEGGGPWLPYSYHVIHTANDHQVRNVSFRAAFLCLNTRAVFGPHPDSAEPTGHRRLSLAPRRRGLRDLLQLRQRDA